MTIRALRKMRKMSQLELAARVGLARTSICNIELGKQILTQNTLGMIAHALGYRVLVRFVPLDRDERADKGEGLP